MNSGDSMSLVSAMAVAEYELDLCQRAFYSNDVDQIDLAVHCMQRLLKASGQGSRRLNEEQRVELQALVNTLQQMKECLVLELADQCARRNLKANGNLDDALALYQTAMASVSPAIQFQAHFNGGILLFHQQRWFDAISNFQLAQSLLCFLDDKQCVKQYGEMITQNITIVLHSMHSAHEASMSTTPADSPNVSVPHGQHFSFNGSAQKPSVQHVRQVPFKASMLTIDTATSPIGRQPVKNSCAKVILHERSTMAAPFMAMSPSVPRPVRDNTNVSVSGPGIAEAKTHHVASVYSDNASSMSALSNSTSVVGSDTPSRRHHIDKSLYSQQLTPQPTPRTSFPVHRNNLAPPLPATNIDVQQSAISAETKKQFVLSSSPYYKLPPENSVSGVTAKLSTRRHHRIRGGSTMTRAAVQPTRSQVGSCVPNTCPNYPSIVAQENIQPTVTNSIQSRASGIPLARSSSSSSSGRSNGSGPLVMGDMNTTTVKVAKDSSSDCQNTLRGPSKSRSSSSDSNTCKTADVPTITKSTATFSTSAVDASLPVYPLNGLKDRQASALLAGIQMEAREKHLSATEFTAVFKMSFKAFEELPHWRKVQMKKAVGLF